MPCVGADWQGSSSVGRYMQVLVDLRQSKLSVPRDQRRLDLD